MDTPKPLIGSDEPIPYPGDEEQEFEEFSDSDAPFDFSSHDDRCANCSVSFKKKSKKKRTIKDKANLIEYVRRNNPTETSQSKFICEKCYLSFTNKKMKDKHDNLQQNQSLTSKITIKRGSSSKSSCTFG